MAISVLDAGSVTRTITAMKVMDGATLRSILRVKVMDSDGVTLRTVYAVSGGGAFTATIDPGIAYGSVISASPAPVTTNSVTCSPTGGVGPFTYLWENIAGEGNAFAVSPTNASTTFHLANVISGNSASATFRCTITDALGSTATATIVATFDNLDFS